MDVVLYMFLAAVVAFAGVAALYVAKAYAGGQSPASALFGPRPEKRLAIMEHMSIDGRRRLVLIRRDGVEHLIMTGGPVDLVVETGIGEREAARQTAAPAPAVATPVFSRPSRSLGQVAAVTDRERVPDRAAE